MPPEKKSGRQDFKDFTIYIPFFCLPKKCIPKNPQKLFLGLMPPEKKSGRQDFKDFTIYIPFFCLPKKKVGDKILKILLYTFPFFVSRKKKWETRF
jgi:hypothetical protein